MTENLEIKVLSEKRKSRKEKIVDAFSNVSYSLVTGAALDYFSGLNFWGIITSRASASGLNAVTGAPYGLWRNFVFNKTRTSDENSIFRKGFVDFLAFNSFQTPIYASAVALGSLVSEGEVKWDKVADGAINLALVSPLIGPTLGIYYDFLRNICGLKSAAEKAGEKLK